MLSQFLIRRTRRFLESNYGEKDPDSERVIFTFPNGDKFSFPKRIAEPLAYVGGENDPGDQLASEDNFRKIGKMTFARYQLAGYLKPDVAGETPDEVQYIEDLKQSKTSAAGFIRTTVLKRLASSPHAFLKTIDRMLLKNRLLEFALENDDLLPVGSYSDFGVTLESEDDLDPEFDLELEGVTETEDIPFHGEKDLLIYGKINTPEAVKFSYGQLSEKNPRGIKWMRSELFEKDKLLKALHKDSEFLQSLIDEYGEWDPNADSKLDSLEGLIKSLNENEKVLVFSEYADTVDYIHNSLKHRLPKLSIVKASSKTADPTDLARRFSPNSNLDLGGLPENSTEIEVLVTTDVLSEGQNLQDCAIVVNWDMPWTIIKIIQRAGRVDRVGQKSPSIRVLTFLAQDAVEDKIKNLGRLKARLNAAKEIFGLDDIFFNDEHVFDYVEGLFDGSADLIGDEGDVDYASFALGIWNSASENDQKDALRLGLGVHSSLANTLEEQVMIYCQTSSGYDVLQRVFTTGDQANSPHSISPIEALRNSECDAGTVAGQELPNHHELVEIAFKEGVVKQLDQAVVLANSGIRKRLYRFLSDFRDDHKVTLYNLTGVEQVMDQLVKAPIQKSCEKSLVDLLRHANKSNDYVHVVNRILEMFHAGELLDLDIEKESVPHLVLSIAIGAKESEDD